MKCVAFITWCHLGQNTCKCGDVLENGAKFSTGLFGVILFSSKQAVNSECSVPSCCWALIIGRERSIFCIAWQSCDSCVGGQHEHRHVYLECVDAVVHVEDGVKDIVTLFFKKLSMQN